MLHREARALALRRIEESVRTEDDFQKVIEWWDKLDENRERRERDHEIGRSTVPLEWGADELYLSDSPETIHELVTDADLSKILEELKPCSCVIIPQQSMRKVSGSLTGISGVSVKLR